MASAAKVTQNQQTNTWQNKFAGTWAQTVCMGHAQPAAAPDDHYASRLMQGHLGMEFVEDFGI